MKILEEILSYKKKSLESRKIARPLEKLQSLLGADLPQPEFRRKLTEKGIHLIAEIKKASPSAGIIREDFDAVGIARAYKEGGASALSVLTEDKFFLGDLSHLKAVREAIDLPVLRKDFIIDEYQVFESKVLGADAILLIAAILDAQKIKEFLKCAKKLKLDVVVEVHTQEELKVALATDAPIIGVNTRNLADFSLDLQILPRLLGIIPPEKIVICESGIKNLDDLAYVKKFKINAVLVGEALMSSDDILAKTKEFTDFLKKR